MSGENGNRRRHVRVPVAAKRITLHLPETDGSRTHVPARLLDLSRGGLSGTAQLPRSALGTAVEVEIEVPKWRFVHALTVPGVIQWMSPDGSRWALRFATQDDASQKKLDDFVSRTQKAFQELVRDGAGPRLAEGLRRIELSFGHTETEGARIVLITSAVAGEGKGPVAAGLSLVLALDGHRTLLVDADAESPSIPGAVESAKGLYDTLALREAKETLDGLAVPIGRNVDLLPSGSAHPAGSVRLVQGLESLLGGLRASSYRYVILNAPPLLQSVSSSLLAGSVDDVFVVVHESLSKERDLIEARDLLSRASAPLRGIVLTDESEGPAPGFWRFGFGRLGSRSRNGAGRQAHAEASGWTGAHR
jgi:Mrp family chromosome partitioning ATPase